MREFVADRGWDQFHAPNNLAMALVGEAGRPAVHYRRGDSHRYAARTTATPRGGLLPRVGELRVDLGTFGGDVLGAGRQLETEWAVDAAPSA